MPITTHPQTGADRSPGAVVRAPDSAPTAHRIIPRVPIMPAHEDVIPLQDPKTGRLIRDENGKPRRRLLRLDEPALRAMAADANERTSRGHDHAITIGHVQLYEPDEEKQPETIGFMRNYDVGPILDPSGAVLDPTPHLYADLHIDGDRYDEAMTYPHRSPEFDPDFTDPSRSTLDSLALLRRHPKFPMGLLRYEREPADVADAPPADPAESQPPPGEEVPMPLSPEDIQAIVEQLTPAIQQAVDDHLSSYAEQAEPEPEPDVAPVQAAEAMPGGMNTFAPELDDKKDEEQYCDSGAKMQYQRDHASLMTKLAKLEQENALLNRRLEDNEDYVGEMIVQNARSTIAKSLDELEGEGVDFDRTAETEELLALDAAGRDRHLSRMRLQYRRNPVGRGFVDAATPKGKGRAIKDEAERDRIVAVATRKGVSFAEAKDLYFAGNV